MKEQTNVERFYEWMDSGDSGLESVKDSVEKYREL